MSLRITIFGQAAFGKDIAEAVADAGHTIVGVYAPPEQGRPDPLAGLAEERGWPLFRHRRFRQKGQAIKELVEEYRALGAELNLMPFTTVILPPEIVDAPAHGSLCFHPSILPAYRGGNALAWQIILGAEEAGVTVFRPDEGVDTGPIVVQRRGVAIDSQETTTSLYFKKLYPMGVEAMLEAVAAVDTGAAQFTPQSGEGASHQGLVDDEVARIDWSRPAAELDRLVRGCDPAPGAHALLDGVVVRLFGSRLAASESAAVAAGTVLGLAQDRLRVAAEGGVLEFAKVRVGDAAKVPAPECGVPADVRFT